MIKNKHYVYIYRYDNNGFQCKPYTSKVFHHVFKFIDSEVKDLNLINQRIENKKIYKPALDDDYWSGCFCFLNEYDFELILPGKALSSWSNKKLNMARLPKKSLIWVRNMNHKGKEFNFYDEFYVQVKDHWYIEQEQLACFMWVKMPVELALKRTELWKAENKSQPLPEWLTEFYLMKEQKDSLIPPPLQKKVSLFFKNLLRAK